MKNRNIDCVYKIVIIKFTIEIHTKRPKLLNESITVFVLFRPRRIKIEPRHFVMIPMNFKIDLPDNIVGIYVILPSLAKEDIKLTEYNTIQKTKFEFFNCSHCKTITVRIYY